MKHAVSALSGTTFAAAILSFGTVLILTASLSAQVSASRHVDVIVTDRNCVSDHNCRFVTGLDKDVFEVVENGIRRVVTGFAGGASPISLAIVGDALPDVSTLMTRGPEDEFILAGSVPEALRQLALSKNPRRGIVITTPGPQLVPPEITAVQVDPSNLLKAVIELRSQYRLEFESSAATSRIEVVLKQPRGLPLLALRWK